MTLWSIFVLTLCKYFGTKEADILVREYCHKIEKKFMQSKMAMCDNSMGFPFRYSLRNSEYLSHSLLRPQMIGLIKSLELVREEVVLKVIRWDIVIRFNSLIFAWIALSGFRSTRKPFFPKSPFRVFNLPGVQIFVLSLIFSRTLFFGSPGCPCFS